MAYAYPNNADAAASNASLGVHSSPARSTLTRKGSEERFDVIREFKVSRRIPDWNAVIAPSTSVKR